MADGFEDVFHGVRDQVESAKDEKDRHCEAGEDFGSLEAEGVPDRGAAPYFKVA